MTWYDQHPRPARQYIIRTRRSRQRIAQALGAGMTPERVAAVERLHGFEVEALLGDDGFHDLIRHYRELADLPPDQRLARLIEVAGEMLERLVETGDLRAVCFVLHEAKRGRDPRRSLAQGAIRRFDRVAAAEPRPAPTRARPDPTWPKPLGVKPADPRRAYAFCAATLADGDAAAALAAAELGRVLRRLQAAGSQLRTQLVGEAERLGMAAGPANAGAGQDRQDHLPVPAPPSSADEARLPPARWLAENRPPTGASGEVGFASTEPVPAAAGTPGAPAPDHPDREVAAAASIRPEYYAGLRGLPRQEALRQLARIARLHGVEPEPVIAAWLASRPPDPAGTGAWI